MKKLLLASVLIATSAHAIEADKATAQDKRKACMNTAELAHAVMDARQAGMTIIKAMEWAGDDKLSIALVETAYARPAALTEEYQQRTISDFETKWFLECTKAMKAK